MNRRSLLWSALLVSPLLLARAPLAAAAADPKQVVADFGDNALQMLADPALSPDQRRQRFRALLDQYFDFPRVARFVLGRWWQSANDTQRRQFTEAFEKYVVAIYSARFADFVGTTFKVTGAFPQGTDVVMVRTDILQKNGAPPAHVDWRVLNGNGAYRITEVSIDGVAMSLTHREEFANILENNGGNIDDLIKRVLARSEGPIK